MSEGQGKASKDLRLARLMLGLVAIGLLVSGLTCYVLPGGVSALLDYLWRRTPDAFPLLEGEYYLLERVERGLAELDANFPEMMLGTDWLGFAHIVLAILFLGALRNPVRNIWVIQFGLVSAILVIPAAFLFGALRGLPTAHYFVDASFGVFAAIPLLIAYKKCRASGEA